MSTFLAISVRLKAFADRWSRIRVKNLMEKNEEVQLIALLQEAYLAGADKALREFVKDGRFQVKN